MVRLFLRLLSIKLNRLIGLGSNASDSDLSHANRLPSLLFLLFQVLSLLNNLLKGSLPLFTNLVVLVEILVLEFIAYAE